MDTELLEEFDKIQDKAYQLRMDMVNLWRRADEDSEEPCERCKIARMAEEIPCIHRAPIDVLMLQENVPRVKVIYCPHFEGCS